MILSQSNSCVPPSSTYSSDSELNNALHVLLDNEKVSQEDTVASAPYIFDPLFPLISLPQTTDLLPQSTSSNLLSQEVSQSTSMSVDTLQPPTSTAHGTVSNSMPIEDSSTTLSLSNSCVLPSSTYSSDPDLNDALHALTRCSQENSETCDGMDPYTFDLFFPVIPLSQTTDLLPQGTSQFASKEQGVDTFQPSKSTAHSHHSNLDSLPMFSSNLPSSPALPPSTYSSPKLRSVNSKNTSREKMAFETEWIRSFDLFSLIPLLESVDLLSQGMSQPVSMERRVQPPTSTAHGTVSDRLPAVPIVESNTTLSQSNSCVPPSSTYFSDPELNDVQRAFLDDENCGQESRETSDGMDPYILDLLLRIPLIPLPQTTNLPPQESSQSASKEQGVDTLQPISSTAHSQLSSLDGSCTTEKVVSEMEPVFDLFSLIPLPQTTNLPPQESSQSASKEQGADTLQPVSSTAHSQLSSLDGSCTTEKVVSEMEPVFDLFSLIPLPQTTNLPPQESSQSASKEQGADTLQPISSTAHSQPSSLDGSCTTEKVVSEMEPVFDLFSLIPLPQTTNLLPQESSQSASKEQGADTLQPISSTAHSQPSSLDGSCTTEKVVSEMEPVFDLFSLIPLPQTTNLPPQESSQSASKEQGVDTLEPIMSTAPPHHLPVDQTTNIQREMGTASPCAQCSHSSVHEDKDNASVYTHTNPDPPHSLEESIQATSGEQFMASSFSSASPSTETASQMEAESNVEAQDCTNRKGKPKKALSVIQQKRQRMLNKVSALHYRQRKKERMSDLDVRKEQLEAENARLKEQVSVLTTEIAKLKRLSKTQKAKFCPFFLHSICNKIKQL